MWWNLSEYYVTDSGYSEGRPCTVCSQIGRGVRVRVRRLREGGGERGVMDDSKVFGLRTGVVELASTQMGKAADKIGSWQKMRNSSFGHVLLPWGFLAYSTQFLMPGFLKTQFSTLFSLLDDHIFSYGFKHHIDTQPANLNLRSRLFT